MKIPAKYVANEFVRIVIMIMKTSGESLTHSSDRVIIAAKTCVSHVESIAYVADVIRFIAHYVQTMMEWMLLPIVKVKVVKMGPFAMDAECLKSTMIAGGVKCCYIPSSLRRMKGLPGRMEG